MVQRWAVRPIVVLVLITYLNYVSQIYFTPLYFQFPFSSYKSKTLIPGIASKQGNHMKDININVQQVQDSYCKEMFSISRSSDASGALRADAMDNIGKIKGNTELSFGSDSETYKSLGKLLPSLLVKSFPIWENVNGIKRISLDDDVRNLSRLTKLAEVLASDISRNDLKSFNVSAVALSRDYMLAHQRNFSYQLRPGFRLKWMQGRVPFLPCRIRDSFDSKSLRRCVKNAGAIKGRSFHLAFVGDSKIRGLLVHFLMETKELNYKLWLEEDLETLESLLLRYQFDQTDAYKNVRAESQTPLGFKLSYLVVTAYNSQGLGPLLLSRNMLKLAKWANGSEEAPDLLVIGYGTWTLFMNSLLQTKLKAADLLDNLWSVNGVLIRLLLNISSKTKVIVLAQSRTRPVLNISKASLIGNFNQTESEWIDSFFLSRLKRLLQASKFDPTRLTADIVDMYYGRNQREGVRNNNIAKLTMYLEKYILPKNPKATKPKMQQTIAKLLKSYAPSSTNRVGRNLWFWDSSLPFNLAAIHDCQTLARHDPLSIKLIPVTTKLPSGRMNFVDPLRRLGANMEEIIQLESMTEYHEHYRKVSKSQPSKEFRYFKNVGSKNLNLKATISTFEADATDRTGPVKVDHETNIAATLSLALSEEEEEERAKLDYYDNFAAAYSWRDLFCTDFRHAGTETEQVEVMQILNLICNRYLNMSNGYCCSNNSD